MMPDDALDTLSGFDTILLGAVGWPGVPDHVSLWGLLIPDSSPFPAVRESQTGQAPAWDASPLRDQEPGDIDFLVVRENSEGEYSDVGGRIHSGTDFEAAMQVNYFSRMGVDRAVRFAFELAVSQGRKEVLGATKSNGIVYSMPFWDEIFDEVGPGLPLHRVEARSCRRAGGFLRDSTAHDGRRGCI